VGRGSGTQSAVPIERSLDQVVDRLTLAEQSPNVRALLIEARRLRSIIANWRAIPPLPQVREEMLARVLHISAAVGEVLPASRGTGTHTSTASLRVVSPSMAGPLEDAPPSLDPGAGERTVITEAIAALPETPLEVQPVPLPEEMAAGLVMFHDPYSLRADAYRALRHRLSSQGDPRIIGVTSAGRREGKSTAAINLAMSLREGARGRVLLVEANMRSPAIAHMLGFIPPACFAEQLARHRNNPLDPWVAVEPVSPFHVMAVHPQGNHAPLLDPIAFSIAMDRLRLAGYDYIVVDTPPVLESADVNMVADSVDAVIVVAMARKTTAGAIRRAADQLGKMTFAGALLLEG
jgi:Mrp family chromosome partitioning ATPase